MIPTLTPFVPLQIKLPWCLALDPGHQRIRTEPVAVLQRRLPHLLFACLSRKFVFGGGSSEYTRYRLICMVC